MPKRKRAESEDANANDSPESREERKIVLRVTRLTNKFDYEIQTLFRALKTARGFERQKMGRRQKTAQKEKNEGALARLQEEVQVLKSLDLEITAQRYLFKQLAKTKRIAESPAFIRFKEAKQFSIESPKSNAESNVIARLFKSTPIKNVMPGIMDGFRALLGVDAAPGAQPMKDSKEKVREEKAEVKAAKSKGNGPREGESEQSDEEAGAEDVSMADIQSDDFAQFDSRLAASSDESESEGAPGDNNDDDISMGGSKKDRYDHAADLSLSPTPSDSESDSPPATSVKASKKASAATKGTVKDTTFLPSLMMGGYWSGSESGDEPAADEPPRRKNRMGQQARRALWEKKYGSGANHVRKEQEKKKNSRDSGWDVRKGAMDPDADGRNRFGKGRSGPGAGRPVHRTGDRGASSYHNSRPSFQEKKAQDDKPLHPSWEAKKRAKEQAAQASFQGTKITFD
ncbi:predicted protein [Paecilomyces variotii No. 5]|uniref:Bud22 domain-containing protein n=1 Tax=Byssochlamys spectabilis (strain No. 5 / NBRC 109023) TaxID=1356009 RepID=V5FZJ4_BYSSN|nr:predicted protein [Paecilomyces variotii No. 5]